MKPDWTSDNGDIRLYCGDALAVLPKLEADSVHCVVTSPPYWGLRDYGVDGQLGLEATLDEFVAKMVEVFREVRRVLRDDGTVWLNLGDSYANDGKWGGTTGGKHAAGLHGEQVGRGKRTTGLKPKDLCGIPWRVAFALQADGWYLRQDIIWHKPNPMPESVTDRCTKSHEYIFLLSKRAKYYYDAEAVKEKAEYGRREGGFRGDGGRYVNNAGFHNSANTGKAGTTGGPNDDPSAGRNRRDVWTITTQPYPNAHFATFPPKLAEPCILAGTSEWGCCPECGAP